jgi:hypothetical protein
VHLPRQHGRLNGGACSLCPTSSLSFTRCTFYGNAGQNGGAIYCEGSNHFDRVIVAFSPRGEAIRTAVAQDIRCTDLYGNAGGDWIGPIQSRLGIDGNVSCDPEFCAPQNGNVSLSASSCCAAGPCGIIGARPIGCTSPLSAESFSEPAPALVVPNPTAGPCRILFENPGSGPVSVRVVDPTGRTLRRFEETRPAGPFGLDWDGTDDAGRPVPSSVYWARIETARESRTARIVLTR